MAYEMRISDWSSDVCSSDLQCSLDQYPARAVRRPYRRADLGEIPRAAAARDYGEAAGGPAAARSGGGDHRRRCLCLGADRRLAAAQESRAAVHPVRGHRAGRPEAERLSDLGADPAAQKGGCRSEEHTSELQSLMRISYAVFCLKKKKKNNKYTPY